MLKRKDSFACRNSRGEAIGDTGQGCSRMLSLPHAHTKGMGRAGGGKRGREDEEVHQFWLFHGRRNVFHETQLKVRFAAQVFNGLQEAGFGQARAIDELRRQSKERRFAANCRKMHPRGTNLGGEPRRRLADEGLELLGQGLRIRKGHWIGRGRIALLLNLCIPKLGQ